MSVVIIRKRRLGATSCKAIASLLERFGIRAEVWRNDLPPPQIEPSMIIRWGCTSTIPQEYSGGRANVLNKAEGIHRVANKLGFLKVMLQADRTLQPTTFVSDSGGATIEQDGLEVVDNLPDGEFVLRPKFHHQGRHLYVVTRDTLLQSLRDPVFSNGWYLRRLINKTAEYRVFVFRGRVAAVCRKVPSDPSSVAWNHHLGASFQNVRWGDWNPEVCRAAIKAFHLTGLDFSGIDIMCDMDKAYVLEANSAPSLPNNSDGSPTYRQKCMSKCFLWHYRNPTTQLLPIGNEDHYSSFIHPSNVEWRD